MTKYRDLVTIPEPLETVKQVRASSSPEVAGRDVSTFVISDRMARQLIDVVLPNLSLDGAPDPKGILTVGAYGTGKSHLLSVLGAICEFPDLLGQVNNDEIQAAAKGIAGRYLVVRFDIGMSAMSLRDIVCTELEKGLAPRGVKFKFEPADKVTNNKDGIEALMAEVDKAHPGKGVLFVLDEMLEYLRTRKDGELVLDLAFLREIGEVSRDTRFRFIGGLQESLFDSSRFSGVADAIKRVRARFEQLRIAREDVAYVVKERLLHKSAAQKKQIRELLQPYSPLFGGMAERMDEFVDLYPVHPSYLQTFEQLTLVEKREILRTIEREIRGMADVDVPTDGPGLLCIDSYRARLAADPVNRTDPSVQEVLDRSGEVRDKLISSMTDRQYVDTAVRVVDALAVHRLTTANIRTPVGMSIEDLRDQLCLIPPGLPKQDATFLRTTIDAIMRKALIAVSGQYIGRNEDNGQLYIDVDRAVDHDQLIAQRAESLDDKELDAAYYTAMEELLGVRDDPFVSGFKIWQYDLTWQVKNVDRMGYLFMGAPNERSTAQPPRDFYVYFLQPFDPPKFIDEERADEVFIRLAKRDEAFTAALKRYAGALEMARSSSDQRPIYRAKTEDARKEMVAWLRANMGSSISVTHRGVQKTLAEWLSEFGGARDSVKSQLDTVAAGLLIDHFDARYPGYPTFGQEITRSNQQDAVRSCLQHLADGNKATSASRKLLQSLELLDGGGNVVPTGRFAQALLDALAKAGGKVVNRGDLLAARNGEATKGVQPVLGWAPWHLEPAWLAVVAGALAHLGLAELAYTDGKVDALTIDRLHKKAAEELVAFTHLAPPPTLPINSLKATARLLGIPEGVIPATGATEAVVTQFATAAAALLNRILDVDSLLTQGLDLWGQDVIDMKDERAKRMASLRSIAEDVRARNAVGKLNKLDLAPDAIAAAEGGKRELDHLTQVLGAHRRLQGGASYLREAQASFGEAHEVSIAAAELRKQMLEALASDPIDDALIAALGNQADALATDAVAAASTYYHHAFLDAAGDARKRTLQEGPAFKALMQLSGVTLLPGGGIAELQRSLVEIRTKSSVDDAALRKSVNVGGDAPCAVAGPSADARLVALEQRVSEIYAKWVETLIATLSENEMQGQIQLLEHGPRMLIEAFVASGELPTPLPDELVSAINQTLNRFDVRTIDPEALLAGLFPGGAAADRASLRTRFDDYLASLGAPGDNVRFRTEA